MIPKPILIHSPSIQRGTRLKVNMTRVTCVSVTVVVSALGCILLKLPFSTVSMSLFVLNIKKALDQDIPITPVH